MSKREAILKYVRELKEKSPCKDCGKMYPYYCLDFDHLPDKDKKVDRIANMIYRVSIEKVIAEIAKCEIVCANCHRIRTFSRASKGWVERIIDEWLGI